MSKECEVDTYNVEYDIRELRSKYRWARNEEDERFLYLVDRIDALAALLQEDVAGGKPVVESPRSDGER